MKSLLGFVNRYEIAWGRVNRDEFGWSLTIEMTSDPIQTDMSVEAAQSPTKIRFSNISSFKLGSISTYFKALVTIRDIKSDQVERICYRVVEEENHFFEFSCETIDTIYIELENSKNTITS